MNKENCIEKICRLPQDFVYMGMSSLTLLENSKYKDFSNEITLEDIQKYLLQNQDLIEHWHLWSHNKRASGYYLDIDSNTYFVEALNKESALDCQKFFATAEQVCAEFILKEINTILNDC